MADARQRQIDPVTAISELEWSTSRIAPDCIVDDLLFSDVGVLVAQGGTGKTTLLLYMALHIILGLPLFDLTVRKSGRFVLITAEDSREMLIARTRRICEELHLNAQSIQAVRDGLLILDVSANVPRLTAVEHDVVKVAPASAQIIDRCREFDPVVIAFDPAVSFGVGEGRTNDAEQGLIEAARTIRSSLNCCVLYVHHTGKENGRNKTSDQYSGRGGSAFADGSRMVFVLNNLSAQDWMAKTGEELKEEQTGIVLARPKLSFRPPLGEIYIRREGYKFDAVRARVGQDTSPASKCAGDIMAFIFEEITQGNWPTQNTIQLRFNAIYRRIDIRSCIKALLEVGLIAEDKVPGNPQRGSKTYLRGVPAPPNVGSNV